MNATNLLSDKASLSIMNSSSSRANLAKPFRMALPTKAPAKILNISNEQRNLCKSNNKSQFNVDSSSLVMA